MKKPKVLRNPLYLRIKRRVYNKNKIIKQKILINNKIQLIIKILRQERKRKR